MSQVVVTSLNDVRIVCSPIFSGKSIAHVQERCTDLPAHPPASPPTIFYCYAQTMSSFLNPKFWACDIYIVWFNVSLSGFHTILPYLVLVWVWLFHYVPQCFCEEANYLHWLFFCSLFIHHLFVWHCFSYCLVCFLAVCYSCCFLCGCCLIDHCGCESCLYVSGFQSVLECHLDDLWLCVCQTESQRYCWAAICVGLTCACCS